MQPENSTIEIQLNHRTIREFTGEPVSEEDFAQLMAVARATASSRGLQQTSIIRITDQAIKDEMAEIATQAYMARAPELLVIVADTHRTQEIAKEQGVAEPFGGSMNCFMEAVTDSALMAQNIVVAAESLGLGTNYFGNVLNDVARVIRLLGLPDLTFPIVGLSLGHPAQEPQLKPRMEMSLRVMENGYREPDSWSAELAEYDEVMRTYYDLREGGKPSDTFTKQTADKLRVENPLRTRMMRVAAAQGFDFALQG
ncbi:MAG: NADPH-dependent oxidoreductase [Ancrocorticia sp.]|uniref:NADPH-dependent oxidoreductase n=1 Tax=Ancrocorticia sp. TaxID=2593684 RepID=UPI003F91FA65